jgi:hypothetical protein
VTRANSTGGVSPIATSTDEPTPQPRLPRLHPIAGERYDNQQRRTPTDENRGSRGAHNARSSHDATTRGLFVGARVDTHLDVHVAAVLDELGGLLDVEMFATTPTGYAELLAWLQRFGVVELVGVEGTGSYGAGLTRLLHARQVRVVERQRRRRRGKSDPPRPSAKCAP